MKKCLTILYIQSVFVFAQTIPLGSGSYTTNFPGTDSAGRNGFPSGTPQLSGSAIGKPVPTNDWWSKLVKEDHADNLFNYPMTLKTTNQGLIVTYIPWGVIGDNSAIEVGLKNLNANKTTVSNYSDWTVTMNWNDGSHNLFATAGIGMPFVYFEKDTNAEVSIKVNSGTVTVDQEMIVIENASNGADFVVYAPLGSVWENTGNTYTSTLNNKLYWSIAMLPQENININTVASSYKKYAYVFPKNTETTWSYNQNSSIVTTSFKVTTDVKEGDGRNVLLGLLPHQWANLASDSDQPNGETYNSVRGDIKTLDSNEFKVENKFSGILPTLPYLANYSEGFSPAELSNKISQIKNDELSDWTDSYNEGQVMNRLIQTARIADQTGDIESRDKMIATVKERLENWLTYQSGEKAFLFYYNSDWSAMLGYPAGHGQDTNINDHHFHWGYFIHAAAFLEQFEPGWANKWGDFINYLVRDAASPDRNDDMFPFLRNFSPYAGHCWANGFASFPQGNDQESTSESMQFNSSLIHWGTITGNTQIRDLGIYLYTTEQTAVEEYWFDMYERNFKNDQQYGMVSRVWGNSYDNGTFWTSDITASYGIELYPIHGGSFYLGQNQNYVEKIWNELQANTGILSTSDTNPNLWHDTIWKYLSMLDPERAIELYNSYPNRILKFGVSDAQTYHWIHNMNAMGVLQPDITSNYPITAVFKKDNELTYVAHNYSNSQITVSFSDGFNLSVPANSMITNKDVDVSGVLTSNFNTAYANGSVDLEVATTGEVSSVIFYDNGTLLGKDLEAPYSFKAENLSLGKHGIYAQVYKGDSFNITNSVDVIVGENTPYNGELISIPGSFESGHYDKFEGGNGQNITYVDLSTHNEGDFRVDESVDVENVNNEGAVVGWINSGEWVTYSVDVKQSGYYNLSFRYASGNSNGGGPFYIDLNNNKVTSDITLQSTSSTNWSTFLTKTVTNIPLQKGEQVLKLVFKGGEFNLGKLTFEYQRDLTYETPLADAGENVNVILPQNSVTLDGSMSTGASTSALTYNWQQLYGPSLATFTNSEVSKPIISNLVEGIYKLRLTVGYGNYTSYDDVFVIVSLTGNTPPSVTITDPLSNTSFREGEFINIKVITSDLDGDITRVEFYNDDVKIGESTSSPHQLTWTNAAVGVHNIWAKAIDDKNESSKSELIKISVNPIQSCKQISKEATQGTFTEGVEVDFETVGTNVIITFKLLDNDKQGVVAFLWKQNPFEETQMDYISDNTFTKTIGGLTKDETINYACKFAYAGGLSATKYFTYKVGESCEKPTPEEFNLSYDNFEVKTTGETCTGKANGSLFIKAKANENYTATLNGEVYYFEHNQLLINNITPGDYSVCVNVQNENYEQCYNFNIQSAQSIEASVTSNSNTSILNITQGTPPYHIKVNGVEVLTTSIKSFPVTLKQGDVVDVSSDIDCEGVFSKKIDINYMLDVYPNPTNNKVNIMVPQNIKKINIQIFNTLNQLIKNDVLQVDKGVLQVDLSNELPGVYFMKLQLSKTVVLKIIKK